MKNNFLNFLKTKATLTFLVAIILLPLFDVAKSQEAPPDPYGFYIKEFNVGAKINNDSSIDVTENIIIDFTQSKHGILRSIPTSYSNSFGLIRKIFISDIKITNNNGEQIQFEKSSLNGVLEFKIGDPNSTISGEQVYNISYKVKNAILFTNERDELFWNITGNAWPVPILKATGSFQLPEQAQGLQTDAFFGPLFSTQKAQKDLSENNLTAIAGNLKSGEGLSLAATWQKGAITRPSALTSFQFFTLANWHLSIPILILAFAFWYLKKHAIDPRGKGTIVPEFSIPKDITLAEGFALYDEHFQTKDLTALIISWATEGFITIKEAKKKSILGNKSEFSLIKKKNLTGRPAYEINFFDYLFGKQKTLNLNKIEPTKFNLELGKMRGQIFTSLKNQGYITKNPETARAIFYVLGALILVSSFILIGFHNVVGTMAIVLTFLSGLLIIVVAPLAPKRTLKGVLVKEKIQGFQLYLKTAERYRLKWQEQTGIFEKYLPYAIALGVAGVWAKNFKDKLSKPPSWYHGYALTDFNAVNFANSLDSNFNSSLNSAIISASSSSGGSAFSGGGGFSGGGFGGGGGGSW